MRHDQFSKQQGVVLIISLIALVAISLAGLALMRTVDTSNVISGNVAFNEAAQQLSDVGAEDAYLKINGLLDPAGCQKTLANCPKNAAGNSYFYPNVAPIDPESKLPAPAGGIVWSDPLAVALPGEATASYSVRYMVERMCGNAITGNTASPGDNTADFTVDPTFAKCRATPMYPDAAGATDIGNLYYRVTVQVSGPRNTRALSQYFYPLQDCVVNTTACPY